MKNLTCTFSILFLLISCTNDQSLTKTSTPNPIEGSWALVSISGGFSPTLNFNPGWITYHFGQNLTVINNNPSQIAQSDGLKTGSYSYSFVENSTFCNDENYHKLSVSSFIDNLCVKIEGNEMIIDTGSDADGLIYKFERVCNNQECSSLVSALVETIDVPQTAILNQNISVPISFTVINGCGQFGYIAETNLGNIKSLKLFERYIGCTCYQSLNTILITYNFTPTTTGNQIIKIEQPDGSYITNSILIQ